MGQIIRAVGAGISGHIATKGRKKAGRSERAGMRKGQERLDTGRQAQLDLYGTSRDRQLAESRNAYRTATRQYSPYAGIGERGAADLAKMGDFSYNPSDVEGSPAYQFRRDQGLEAVNRSLASGGMRNSGNRLIGLTDYAQGLASTEFEADWTRKFSEYQKQFDTAMGRISFGSGIADRLANLSTGYGNTRSNIYGNYGVQAAGAEAQYAQDSANVEMGIGASYAGQRMDVANTWAATNMYAADQIGSMFDPSGGGGGDMGGMGG